MLQDGNQLAIVTAAKCEAGRGKADGLTVCELTWMIIAGDQSCQSLATRYFYEDQLPRRLMDDFLRLGLRVRGPEEVDKVRDQLVGRIARLTLKTDEGKQRVFVGNYVGCGDPAQYHPA